MSAKASRQAQHRSGSETRRRSSGAVLVRLLEDERSALKLRAREVGLSLAGYLRASALGTPGPRTQRTPPVKAEELARATAALNKVGSNINQIAHRLNAAGSLGLASECRDALGVVREALEAIREIVGRRERR